MPRFDLAGNPLPDNSAASPPDVSRPRAAVPHADIPPRHDALGRTLHTAPAPSAPLSSPPSVPAASPTMIAPAGADTVRYDLAGNVISSAPAPSATYVAGPTSGAPAYAGSAAAGTWPPAPAGMGQPSFYNSSGEQGDIPPEVARLKWNWGAFFFPVFWCKKHGMTTLAATLGGLLLVLRWARRITLFVNPAIYGFLLLIYGLTYFGIAVYFGLTGHKYGWRNRRFEHVEDYLSCQRKWMWWGFGINGVLAVLLPVLIFAGLIGLGLSAAHQSNSLNGGSGYSRSLSGNGFGGGSVPSAPADTSGAPAGSGQ